MLFRIYFALMFCCTVVLSFEDLDTLKPERRIKAPKAILEFPNNSDIEEYLEALDRVLNYCNIHRNDIDLNFYFGLFVANVNLQRVYRDKYQILPGNIRISIFKLINKLEELSQFFAFMVAADQNERDKENKAIFSHFAEPLAWLDLLPKFHEDLLPSDGEEALIKKLLSSLNIRDFNDYYAWSPTPAQSNTCLDNLATSSTKGAKKTGRSVQCQVLTECRSMLKFGTDFGYAMAHRLLYLLVAKYSRRCNIFSEQQDKKLADRFCAIAYQEVIYSLENNYTNADILMEHVTLCSLDGHAQFLRRDWIRHFLLFQTPYGCFTEDIEKIMHPPTVLENTTPVPWTIGNTQNNMILGGACNAHTSALATGALATAVRFVIERQ